MLDLIRFVWRGALGGAIIPFLWLTYFLILVFGTPWFWALLISSTFLAIPGAIVGTILWICAWFFDRLGIGLRVTIGVAVNAMFLLFEWLTSNDSFSSRPSYFGRLIFLSTCFLVSGGVAGWLCPAAMIYRREREPPIGNESGSMRQHKRNVTFGKGN